jgi:beta-ribofuranosylaminobenzene 5'-phosphate synthase
MFKRRAAIGVRIIAGARVHCGLFDMGGATFRAYGGIGFGLRGNWTQLALIRGLGENKFPAAMERRTRVEIAGLQRRIICLYPKARAYLNIERHALEHIGLGSKSILCLAIIEAYNHLFQLKIHPDDACDLSGRGGASGVGINTFYKGGWISDAGHAQFKTNKKLQPSAGRKEFLVPKIITRTMSPAMWRVHLFTPKNIIKHTKKEELIFFRDNTPIPAAEVNETIAAAYHGIIPAVMNEDISTLRLSLQRLNSVGFKKREINRYGTEYAKLISEIGSIMPEAAIGMSSLGPLIYCIDHNQKSKQYTGGIFYNYLGSYTINNAKNFRVAFIYG